MNWNDSVSELNRVCFETFGIPVLYFPSQERLDVHVAEVELSGIFSEYDESALMVVNDGMETVINRKKLEIRQSSLDFSPMKDDEVMVNTVLYRIVDLKANDKGIVTLDLVRSESIFW